LRSVFVDMFFLSLVETGHFPISARRSFDLLIPNGHGEHVYRHSIWKFN
jgi:hypothetical protein